MTRNLNFVKDPRDTSFSIDNNSGPLDAHVFVAEVGFLLPYPERLGQHMLVIDEQLVRKVVFFLELPVRLQTIRTYSHHHCIDLPKLGKGVAKIGRFLRSTRGIVLRIKEKD